MYCLQWLIPVLLIPKPVNLAFLSNHVVVMVLYLVGFFLERKPCTMCSLVFLTILILISNSGDDSDPESSALLDENLSHRSETGGPAANFHGAAREKFFWYDAAVQALSGSHVTLDERY